MDISNEETVIRKEKHLDSKTRNSEKKRDLMKKIGKKVPFRRLLLRGAKTKRPLQK